MNDTGANSDATVPAQPEFKPPLRKSPPVIIVLILIVGLIGLTNLASFLHGNQKVVPPSALSTRPTAPNAQQVSSFEMQQQLQARRDAEERQRQKEMAAAVQQLEDSQTDPQAETPDTPPMTRAQRAAIYGDSPRAPTQTSESSQLQAEAKQRRLAKEKLEQDALNSATMALDFSHNGPDSPTAASTGSPASPASQAPSQLITEHQENTDQRRDGLAAFGFDVYQGQLYRVFEGTVLEGVVTNHIDGGFNGPVLVDLTTDVYSHDHQQLLLPQGTRLLGEIQSAGNQQQRKLFVTFHRAICPDGFSVEFAKYIALDQFGTTGIATKVDHGYFEAFAAAAAIGGLGGLAQIGNNGSVLDPSAEIRNGISAQSAAEGEQVLNHFLNRLPVITLKEGSRVRIYIGSDLLLPAYDQHRVNPTL
jgi:type IV secretory pathway VirB10-like protein